MELKCFHCIKGDASYLYVWPNYGIVGSDGRYLLSPGNERKDYMAKLHSEVRALYCNQCALNVLRPPFDPRGKIMSFILPETRRTLPKKHEDIAVCVIKENQYPCPNCYGSGVIIKFNGYYDVDGVAFYNQHECSDCDGLGKLIKKEKEGFCTDHHLKYLFKCEVCSKLLCFDCAYYSVRGNFGLEGPRCEEHVAGEGGTWLTANYMWHYPKDKRIGGNYQSGIIDNFIDESEVNDNE